MENKIKVTSSQLTEYTRWVGFQYEGEEYELMTSVGKNFSDMSLFKKLPSGAVKVTDIPDWAGEDGELLWDIDNLGWEYEQEGVK
jgi:hypothetical protein